MSEEEAGPNVGVVMDAPGGQRFVDRLIRSGVVARVVAPGSFDQHVRAGQLYLIPVSLSADSVGVTTRGAHVCVIPPWPVEPLTFGAAPHASQVSVTQVSQSGGARYAAALGAQASGKAIQAALPLRILYRERLTGASGLPLVESDTGEPLLAALPRISNRHGHVLVTTLQLSVASAQTQLADVARLIRDLSDWLLEHSEPAAAVREGEPSAPAGKELGEEDAPLVALALALIASEHGAAARVSAKDAWEAFQLVRGAMGSPPEQAQFEAGLAWLAAHSVVSLKAHGAVTVERAAMEQYSVLWDLAPRLRRLRHLARDAESRL